MVSVCESAVVELAGGSIINRDGRAGALIGRCNIHPTLTRGMSMAFGVHLCIVVLNRHCVFSSFSLSLPSLCAVRHPVASEG